MQARDPVPLEFPSTPESLEQQVRVLRERLAFYEGFDLLIQDNVAQARELFRLAAQEREAASSASDRVRREAGRRETQLRAELETIAADVHELAGAVEALSRRIARALGEPEEANGWLLPFETVTGSPVAVVIHGVPSARTALSLQRFLASLPHVVIVAAREYAGGVLRLDARVQDPLRVDHFRGWEDWRRVRLLTERPDVIELALDEVTG